VRRVYVERGIFGFAFKLHHDAVGAKSLDSRIDGRCPKRRIRCVDIIFQRFDPEAWLSSPI